MKLFDLAMAIDRPSLPVKLIDQKSCRIAFDGTAESLLDYSGIDYRKAVRIDIKQNTLVIEIK